MISITSVKIYPFEPGLLQTNLRAYAEVILDNSLLIKGIKVMENKNGGLFIGYPAQKGKDDTWYDLIIPLNDEVKKRIRDAVIDEFKESRE